MRKGESLGELVSKLGCNLHKSPGVIGSRTTEPRKDGGTLGSNGREGSGVQNTLPHFTFVLARKPQRFQNHSF